MSLRKLQQIIKVAGALALGAVLSFLPLINSKSVSATSASYQESISSDKATANRGETIKYTLSVVNNGSSDLHDFFFVNYLPKNYVTYAAGSSVATKDSVAKTITDAWIGEGADGFNFGTLAPSQTASITFSVTVKNDAPDGAGLRDEAYFKCNELPEWRHAFVDVRVLAPEAPASWQYGIEVDKKTAQRGDTLRYTAQIKNTGKQILNKIRVYDYLPKHVTYKRGTTSFVLGSDRYPVEDGWLVDEMGINVEKILVGETLTLYFDVTIDGGAQNGEKLDNIMFFKSAEFPNEGQCLAQTVVEVPANGVILSIDKKVKWENGDWMDSIEKGAHGHVFAAGEKVFYQIVIQNTGDEGVDNMKIEDILPEYIQINDNTTVVTMVGRLDPGQSKTYEFEAKVKDAPSGERKQENVAKLKSGDEEKARDLAYVWIAGGSQSVLGEQAPTKLPEAGAETLVMSIAGSLGMSLIGIGLRKKSEAIAI